MVYNPKPIDTSRVNLPPEIMDLIERLAENNHDLWAARRLAEGWRCGAQRDDTARTHPNLVPYGDLTESEKEYDRTNAIEVLKVMIALGYRITSPSEG